MEITDKVVKMLIDSLYFDEYLSNNMNVDEQIELYFDIK